MVETLKGDPPGLVEASIAHFRAEGSAARKAGEARADCPYEITTLARGHWNEGFDGAGDVA